LHETGCYDESDEEKAETKKQLGLYKGFPLLDPNLKAVPGSDGKFEVKIRDPDKAVRYTKELIDIFRSPTPGHIGNYSDIFTKKEQGRDRRGNNIEVFANSKPEECLGFQPGDFLKFDADENMLVTANGS
jgi:hypothetical protein